MPKVSVLVAVYNAEKFLPQCLDSLLGQTLSDIQIICVDDASTDNSLKVLNHYAVKDLRLEVIRLEENSGQAHARNEALKIATGDYICMVDADDWLATDALEQAVSAFDDETDCVLFDVIMVYGQTSNLKPQTSNFKLQTSKFKPQTSNFKLQTSNFKEEPYPLPPFTALTGDEAFRLSLTWQIHGLYMVRGAIHHQHPYDETCRLYSDDNTTRIHYVSSRQVRRCSGRYYYRQHPASATHRTSVRRFDYLKANESMKQQMLALHVGSDLLALYENHRWLNLIDVCMFYHVHGHKLSESDRRYGLGEIRRVWATIDRHLLNKESTAKFGYRLCGSWTLFRLQEWLYFTLRGLLGRNR